MSVESVRAFFAAHAPDIPVLVTDASSATVNEAAAAHGVRSAQIAKTLSLRVRDRVLLVVTGGEARLDNRKVKDTFGGKATMLGGDEVEAITGHPVGGVSVWLEGAAADLLRRVAESVRRGGAGGGLAQQRGSHRARANG